jgi:ribosomal 30S subunit maturation factor RimM
MDVILSASAPPDAICVVVGIVVVTYGLRGVLKLLLSRKMGK